MRSWKPQFLLDGKWCDNAVRFATREEAEQNAFDKFMLWTTPQEYRAAESDDPVNYSYVNGVLKHLPQPQEEKQ